MSAPILLAVLAAVALLSWAATGGVLRLLKAWNVFDQPNHRSSHQRATPRGGGLAVVSVIALVWIGGALAYGLQPAGFWPLLCGLALLVAVSWLDDLRSQPARLRFGVQVAAVTFALWGAGSQALVFQGLLPPLADHLIVALAWLWFINLFNFMDGIDGISAVECISVAGGLALCAAVAGFGPGYVFLAASLAAAALGFLVWNWAPARIFLGDVGSVPLGFLVGWLLILLAAGGQWAAALILPLYYLADASWTLSRRILRREALWKGHRNHFYQKAVRRGLSHAAVSTRILLCNLVLVALALTAVLGQPWPALAAACLAVAVLLIMLIGKGLPARDDKAPGEHGPR